MESSEEVEEIRIDYFIRTSISYHSSFITFNLNPRLNLLSNP